MNLPIGADTRTTTKQQIEICDFAIVCFSSSLFSRASSDIGREISLICDEYRKKIGDENWLKPIKIDECDMTKASSWNIDDRTSILDLNYLDFPKLGIRYSLIKLINDCGGEIEDFDDFDRNYCKKLLDDDSEKDDEIIIQRNSLLNDLSKSELLTFQRLCSVSIAVPSSRENELLDVRAINFQRSITGSSISNIRNPFLELLKFNISFDDLIQMEHRRLISLSGNWPAYQTNIILYAKKKYVLLNNTQGNNTQETIIVGIPFTPLGRELYKIIPLEFNQIFFNRLSVFYNKGDNLTLQEF